MISMKQGDFHVACTVRDKRDKREMHGVIKVPPTSVKMVSHENRYHHHVQHEMPCKKIYILLHFYSQINE